MATEKELLAIVEALTEFRSENNEVAGAMSRLETKELNWLEEETRHLHAIAKGLADLKKQTERQLNKKVSGLITPSEKYGVSTLYDEVYPLQSKLIQADQQKDKQLLEKARISSNNYKAKDYLGDRKKYQLIYLNDKLVVPKGLQSKIASWYHVNLCHPGQTRTETTIRQHFTWKNMRKDLEQVCKNVTHIN
eukprot:15352022-Ditylum_brightwellii.AAC.1